MFHTYLLKSLKTGKSYVGVTGGKVQDRLNEHNIGSNKFTKANRPFKLIYYESYFCKRDSLHREKFLKSGVGNKLVKAILKQFDNGD